MLCGQSTSNMQIYFTHVYVTAQNHIKRHICLMKVDRTLGMYLTAIHRVELADAASRGACN
jgi:hypothetical protein